MTKLLIFSDSHGRSERIKEIISNKSADYFIHCGDFDADLQASNSYKVRGNCDPLSLEPLERLLTIESKRILIVHGHKYRVKNGLLALTYAAKEKQADIVLFGHTHQRLAVESEGILLLNPGSIGLPHFDEPASYLELRIDQNLVEFEFHFLK